MPKRDQKGVGALGLAAGMLGLLFVALAIFAAVTYQDRNKYRDKTDQIVAGAVTTAKSQQAAADKKQYAEENKKPYKIFTGNDAYGSITFQYPKTWSGRLSMM